MKAIFKKTSLVGLTLYCMTASSISLHCSNATNTTSYSMWTYDIGPRPQEGTLLQKTSVTHNNKVLGEHVIREDEEPTQEEIIFKSDLATRINLKVIEDNNIRRTTYAINAIIYKRNWFEPGYQEVIEDYFICQLEKFILPPP